MRTLICLSSLLREKVIVDQSFSSLISRVIKHLPSKPDILGHFPPPESNCVDILREYANQCIFRFEDDPELSREQLSWSRFMSAYQPNGIRANLLQWLSMKKCERIKQELERVKGPYDLVFHTRPDLYYLNALDLGFSGLEAGRLYISNQDCWRGYNDRYSYGSSRTMGQRMRIYDFFSKRWYPQRLKKEKRLGQGKILPWNPELVLADYLRGVLRAEVKKTGLIAIRLKQYQGIIYGLVPSPRGLISAEFSQNNDFAPEEQGELLDMLTGLTRHPEAISLAPSRIKNYVPFKIITDKLYLRSREFR